MINMLRKNVGRPTVLIIQFITEYIIELTLLHISLCLLFNITEHRTNLNFAFS
jgi:hypothetical protein